MAFLDTSPELKIDLSGRTPCRRIPDQVWTGQASWALAADIPSARGSRTIFFYSGSKRSQPTAFFHHDNGRHRPHLHLVEAPLQQHQPRNGMASWKPMLKTVILSVTSTIFVSWVTEKPLAIQVLASAEECYHRLSASPRLISIGPFAFFAGLLGSSTLPKSGNAP